MKKFSQNRKKRKTNQKSQNFWRQRVSKRILKENNNSITGLIAQSFSCLPEKKGGKAFSVCGKAAKFFIC